jgi:membrane associated rhomboid family serine protease
MPRERYSASRRRHIFLALLVASLSCLAISVEAFSSVALKSSRQVSLSPLFSQQGNQKRIAKQPSHPSSQFKSLFTTFHQPSSTALQTYSGVGSSVTSTPAPTSPKTRATAVYALMLINLAVFLLDKVFHFPFVARQLYLFHRSWKWWQPLTSCFCHADRFHISNNLFMLLLFGRSVEDDQGWGGLLLSYFICGVAASVASIFLLPKSTVSIGASGAVFGLFAVSTLAKLSSWRDLDWRKLVEVAVLGEFVFRQMASEISTAAGGGTAGINHVAHLSGAAAGALLVFTMKATVAKFEDGGGRVRAKLQKK